MAFVADETVWVQHPRHVHRIGFGAVQRSRLKSLAILTTTSLSRPAPETAKKRTCTLAGRGRLWRPALFRAPGLGGTFSFQGFGLPIWDGRACSMGKLAYLLLLLSPNVMNTQAPHALSNRLCRNSSSRLMRFCKESDSSSSGMGPNIGTQEHVILAERTLRACEHVSVWNYSSSYPKEAKRCNTCMTCRSGNLASRNGFLQASDLVKRLDHRKKALKLS